MKKGLLIVLSGPSGVGKGTVLKEFIHDPDLKLSYSVSMTTRTKRPGEVEGRNYYFVTKDEFEKAIADDEFLEWAEFVGNFYGTPLKEVERLRSEGRNVLLEIEVQGCIQVMESNLADIKGRLDKLALTRENVFAMISNNEIPATTTLVSMVDSCFQNKRTVVVSSEKEKELFL